MSMIISKISRTTGRGEPCSLDDVVKSMRVKAGRAARVTKAGVKILLESNDLLADSNYLYVKVD